MIVLQQSLRDAPWMAQQTRRLPGVQPLDMADWLRVDEAFAGQMARRDGLLAERPHEVLAEARGAAGAELFARIVELLPGLGYRLGAGVAVRPDGVEAALEPDTPLATLGRLVQADLCLMEKPPGGDEHVLSAAVLCFPARWRLADKLGRPMTAIHAPIASYDAGIAARVQRMFDAMRPETPLWRVNAALVEDPELFLPVPNHSHRVPATGRAGFIRSERQCLVKLPESGAVVFSIHTVVVPLSALSAEQVAGLEAHPLTEVS